MPDAMRELNVFKRRVKLYTADTHLHPGKKMTLMEIVNLYLFLRHKRGRALVCKVNPLQVVQKYHRSQI